MTKPKALSAPVGLSERSTVLWGQIVPRRARSPERLALLQQALVALDRADQCREILEREGLTVTTKTTGAVHVHPLLKVEREQRQLFVRCWDLLSLTWDSSKDGAVAGF